MYKHIKEDKDFYDLAILLSENKPSAVFCDLETTGLDERIDKILLFQIKACGEIFIFDFLNLNNEHLKYLVNLLQKEKVISVFHNTKFDLKFLFHNTGIWMQNCFDTMNCEVLLNAGVGKSFYSLKDLALKYCDIEIEKESRDLFHTTEITDFTEQLLNYSAMDVEVLEGIYEQQLLLIKEAREQKVLELEMNLLPVVAKMEYDGVILDKDSWLALEAIQIKKVEEYTPIIMNGFVDSFEVENYADAYELAKKLAIPVKTKKLEAELRLLTTTDVIKEWTRQHLNLNSSKQLQASLGLLGMHVTSVDKKKVLKKLDKHPVVDAMMSKSEAQKMVSTYGSNVIALIHSLTGRLHTDYLNMGAETGRFSSRNPNLQNMPTLDGYRESFFATEGWDWLSLDYSQQEFREAGALSGERKIIDAYLAGADMHAATAAVVLGINIKDVTPKERKYGKTINFAILYGTTEWGLKKNLNISIQEAKEIIRKFYDGYPTLAAFKASAEDMIMKLGYSTTILGRRKYISPKPLYMNGNEYMMWESKQKREGFNHIIQGGGVDITKIAMVNIYNNNPFRDKFRMLIPVHDEINSEAHKSISRDAVEFVREEMLKAEQPFLGEIPAKVDHHIESHWVH